ncbi:hypothetical protein COCON_G00152010 [Conger conger]|uniref:Uncharacterized protein n=1 Tax=Conger conger TaxID=82655 RepID=A0A9Q1D9A7_CONCO|nr:hypothetical protein COCON_G00152010 [Conger conger]
MVPMNWTQSVLCVWAGSLEPIPAYIGRKAGIHPGQDTHTLIPMGNLDSPISLTCMSLDCGRKPECPEETHPDTGRTCKLRTERPRPTGIQYQSSLVLVNSIGRLSDGTHLQYRI